MNIIENYRPGGKYSSVHFGKLTRFEKATEQAKLEIREVQEIMDYTNEYLQLIGIERVQNPIVKNESFCNNIYKKLKENNNLEDERDIVWMKFTEDRYLGVVAVGNDINFQIPNNQSEYNEKTYRNRWKYNTSGIIIHYLKKRWDENFVLTFPLKNIPDGITRKDVEGGIGDYLIKKGVPILDFYSHRY
ncbi:hypothetical protein [Anaerocolumna aminovalerica]|uniref:hypothetical protein n=1 Tax=Anaerocolumna aminovalerica TaxID=1527 RepID=UPI000BE3EA86|nr:hypothetical protein [Anaerocolumna aminovalerica]